MLVYQYFSSIVSRGINILNLSDVVGTTLIVVDLIVVAFALSFVKGGKKSNWSGSKFVFSNDYKLVLFSGSYSVWRPYFKKDGYYGLFFETTFWA